MKHKEGKAYVHFSDGREVVEEMDIKDFIRLTCIHTKAISDKE